MAAPSTLPAQLRIALTGAAGSLAADVIPGLLARGHRLTCIDRRLPQDRRGCTWVHCEITDRAALQQAMTGCDAVVHLAGIPLEDDWAPLLAANIDGTQAVLESARVLGIGKVVLASSIHAAGFVPVPPAGELVPDDVRVRPNTFYGVTKAAAEALGSMYHDRHGLDVVCLRIASRTDRPHDDRMLSTWLSPADAVRLLDAAVSPTVTGFRTVWGVSRNTRAYLSPAGGAAIGFHPQDDAEPYATEILALRGEDPAAPDWNRRFIGGTFCSPTPPRYRAPLASRDE
jgi:uronate dehydrogenase